MKALAILAIALLPLTALADERELQINMESALAVPTQTPRLLHGSHTLTTRYGITDTWALDASLTLTPGVALKFQKPDHSEHFDAFHTTFAVGPTLRHGYRFIVSLTPKVGLRWTVLDFRFSSPGVPPTEPRHQLTAVFGFANATFDVQKFARPELSAGLGLGAYFTI